MQPTDTSFDKPFIPASKHLPEITFKAVIISIFITAILAATNAYLALKLGTTISGSIPAAVAAMAILHWFKHSNPLETNVIQTAASAGEGIAAAAAFILPALIILHYWTHFQYWDTVILAGLGGILGVMFSIPLRQILLNHPTLRFPEGTAIGNVLIASAKTDISITPLVYGGIVGGLIGLFQTGFRLISDNLQLWVFAPGKTLFGFAFGFSPAMIAAGYIIGLDVAVTLLFGSVAWWLIGIPFISHTTHLVHSTTPYQAAIQIWAQTLRFVGIGTMLVGGLWTLITLIKPIWTGVKNSVQSMRALTKGFYITLPRTERDIPFIVVAWTILFILFAFFVAFLFLMGMLDEPIAINYQFLLGITAVLFVFIFGFLIASICGYFAGLVGSTNNPLSGLLISAVLIFSALILALFGRALHLEETNAKQFAINIIILVATTISTTAVIANENMQDLKAGKMVGSTPWKQQVMLIVGVLISVVLIAPIFNLLFQAYGIGGVTPRPGMDPSQILLAPQASLMATIATGVFDRTLPWNKIIIGGVFAVFCIILDEILKRKNHRLPVLAVGLGIYLPPEVITPIFFGALAGELAKHFVLKKKDSVSYKKAHHKGTILACGLVAGAALINVILAIPFVLKGSSDALKLAPQGFMPIAEFFGVISSLGLCYWLYHTVIKHK